MHYRLFPRYTSPFMTACRWACSHEPDASVATCGFLPCAFSAFLLNIKCAVSSPAARPVMVRIGRSWERTSPASGLDGYQKENSPLFSMFSTVFYLMIDERPARRVLPFMLPIRRLRHKN